LSLDATEDSAESPNKITVPDVNLAKALFGEHEAHLKLIEADVGLKIYARGNTVRLEGDQIEVNLAKRTLTQLYGLLKEGFPLYPQDVDYAIRILKGGREANLKEIFLDTVYIAADKSVVTPKSVAQKEYIEAIRTKDIVFGIGPAGTGKTYLAMAMAVAELSGGSINRIILARPAVEAGEKLGFLPGDLYAKVNPYLRPLYDALYDMLDFERAGRLISKGIIEVAPLAFMRGRTLNDSFVILDEAQNTTSEQMKMFLTRLGFSSKAVITGDITQTDLPEGTISGLVEASQIFSDIEGISFIRFSEQDVVRHRLVRAIIKAYDKLEEQNRTAGPVRPAKKEK
jgi:phosphate starvation-inducible PhoH-like protein